MSFRNFLCRQRRHEDGDHHELDLKSSRFNGNYTRLVPQKKLQNFKNH